MAAAPPAPTVKELEALSRARLADAEALLAANRFDGGFYLCGYVVELALKARICRTLKWKQYPAVLPQAFHIHNLDILLMLSGKNPKIKNDPKLLTHWSVVGTWTETWRYRPATASQQNLKDMCAAARALMEVLLK